MRHSKLFLAIVASGCLGSGFAYAAEGEITAADIQALEGQSEQPQASKPASGAVQNSANVLPASAFDASGIPVPAGRTARPMHVGGFNLYPSAILSSGYDSNVTQAPESSRQKSYFTNLRPSLVGEALYRADSYRVAYLGDYIHYNSVPANSVMNNSLLFQAQNVFTTRSSIAWGASWLDKYDPVGSTDRSVDSNKADHHRDWLVNTTYRYGADGAHGRVEIDGGLGGKHYLNNRDTTETADVDNTNLGARFFYRVSPRTQLLTEVRNTTYDYARDTLKQNNAEQRYLVGAQWEASAATTGTVKLGYQVKNYTNGERKDYSGATWEAGIRWAPLSYSSFDFLTGRAATDSSSSTGGAVITYNASLAWNHDWKTYLHSVATLGQQRSKYNDSDRADRVSTIGAALSYDFRRWLRVGAEVQHTKRNSNYDENDYSRNIVMLNFNMIY